MSCHLDKFDLNEILLMEQVMPQFNQSSCTLFYYKKKTKNTFITDKLFIHDVLYNVIRSGQSVWLYPHRRTVKTVEHIVQRGFVKVTRNTHLHVSMCIHTLPSTSPTPLGVKTQKLNAACLWFLI